MTVFTDWTQLTFFFFTTGAFFLFAFPNSQCTNCRDIMWSLAMCLCVFVTPNPGGSDRVILATNSSYQCCIFQFSFFLKDFQLIPNLSISSARALHAITLPVKFSFYILYIYSHGFHWALLVWQFRNIQYKVTTIIMINIITFLT